MTSTRTSRRLAVAVLLAASTGLGPLRAQLIPPVVRRPAAAAPLAGVWQGTATEQVEGVGQLTFPIELRFAGAPEALTLEVRGRGQMRTEDGQQLTFVITAGYRGALRDGQLQMRSEKVETRIVEYDQVVASAPQTLTAQLVDGELRGRVGSEGEGWTSFTARAAEAGAGDAVAPMGGLPGTWRGTVREPGPDGKPMTYPIEVRITGADSGLRAELSADLQYPTGDGNTVPVEYRASFRGSANAGELRLDSEAVRFRVVPQDRTENGPPQRITGRLVDGVLRLELTSEGNAPTQIELRRAGGPEGQAAAVEAPEARGGITNPLADPGRRAAPGVTGGITNPLADPARQAAPGATGGPSPYATLVLEPTRVLDRALGGVHSHTLMVPRGWSFEGGVLWTPDPDRFVHFVGAIRGPQREEVVFGRSLATKYQAFNGQMQGDAAAIGREQADGTILRPLPRRNGEIAVEVLLPRIRPGATDVRLVDAERLPEVEELVRQVYAEPLQMLEQTLESMRRDSTVDAMVSARMFLVAERVRVRYRLDGQEWEEEFRSTQMGQSFAMRNSFMRSETNHCGIFDVRSFRAVAGELEPRLPTLLSLAGTLRETPAWSLAIAQMRAEIARARAAGRQAAFEAAQRAAATTASSDVSDIQMEGWRRRQESIDGMHKATIHSIHETQDFRHGDGSTYTFTNQFDRAFMNAGGQVVLTSDPGLRPDADPRFGGVGWQELQRVDPFGGR